MEYIVTSAKGRKHDEDVSVGEADNVTVVADNKGQAKRNASGILIYVHGWKEVNSIQVREKS